MNKTRYRYYGDRTNTLIRRGIRRMERPSQILENLLQMQESFTEAELISFRPFKNNRCLLDVELSTYGEKWS